MEELSRNFEDCSIGIFIYIVTFENIEGAFQVEFAPHPFGWGPLGGYSFVEWCGHYVRYFYV